MTIKHIKNKLAEHKDDLEKQFYVSQIGIFGSYAKGIHKKLSDVDILADFKAPISLLDLVRLEIFLSLLLRIKVDLVPKTDLRPELREKILKEVIYV
jgi:predicted nucleotidyltransferase